MRRIFIAIALAFFAATVYVVGWSSLLVASSLEVTGAPTPLAAKKVEQLSGIKSGEQLARIDVRAIRTKLEPVKWIEQADVHRNWFSKKVTIALTPRTPIARVNSLYLSADGTTFDLPGGFKEKLPTVSAPTAAAAIAATELFTALPLDFRESITAMSGNGRNFAMVMQSGGRSISVTWGSNSENELKLRVFTALISRPENKKITSMDLSAPHAPLVR